MDRRLRKQETTNNEDVANNANMIIRPINLDVNLMRKSSSAEISPLTRARKSQAVEMKAAKEKNSRKPTTATLTTEGVDY
jgi:hypothetical protein